jgi:Asp-tRNAAsn/Glu-tRNAGln amidotransferase A subunit and related amidases
MTAPCDLTLAEASHAIAARRLSPVELVRSVLSRIEAVEPFVTSYITICGDAALDAARAAETAIMAGRLRGPLHGIPYGLKDNFFTAGIRTTACSRLMADHVPHSSATAHVRLQEAGAILLGKLSTYEYGTGTGADSFELPFPPARNPWNTDHFTGGSSTGSGAAVAAGTAMFALGADTGGSIRLPAAGCGVFGLKPSFGLVSKAGVLPNAWSLDHVGPLTRTAGDAALVMTAIAGHDVLDPSSACAAPPNFTDGIGTDIKGLRIGVLRSLHDPAIDAALAAAFEQAVQILREMGAVLVDLNLEETQSAFIDCARIINMSECFAIHERAFRESREQMGSALRDKLTAGATIRAAELLRAQRWRQVLTGAVDRLFASCDVLCCAGTATPAPRLDQPRDVADFTSRSSMAPFSLSGHPAASICTGFEPSGLPLNMQIAAPYFQEPMLLRVASAYESATRHWQRRPVPTAASREGWQGAARTLPNPRLSGDPVSAYAQIPLISPEEEIAFRTHRDRISMIFKMHSEILSPKASY